MNNEKLFNSELDELAKERETLKTKEKELKKQIEKINNEIIKKLGSIEDHKTDNFHFVHKIIITPAHMVRETISQPLKVYN